MNIEARKIEFIQDFLKLKSEETISQLENILRNVKRSEESILTPMTEEELNQRIDQSESDFLNNRYISSSDLLAKYE